MSEAASASKVVTACQVCGATGLTSVLFLGYVPPVNDMAPVGARLAERRMFPLELLRCPACHLVQIGCEVTPEVLFPPDYPYTSGTTRILRENFAQLFETCRARLGLDSGSLVVDVGSNDGTLLSNFLAGGCRVVGVEPTARGELAIGQGIPTYRRFFDREAAGIVRQEHGPADLVTATNVFAHVPDVGGVVAGVLDLLADGGAFVSESHYLMDLIATLQFDTVYHEHLRYYSLHTVRHLLSLHGLEVFHVERIPTHGGSIRVFAARPGCRTVDPSVASLLGEETSFGLQEPDTYAAFRDRVYAFKRDFLRLLGEVRSRGDRVYGVGAPSRASTLVSFTGLDQDTVAQVMEVPGSFKVGRYMPGTLIPVVEESALYEDQPEYALLFSWHIAGELMPRLREKGYAGRFILPLPEPRVIPPGEA